MIEHDIAGLRRAILEEPGDDALRLILADALRDTSDERDYAEGEFIAASMRLASMPICHRHVDICGCASCIAYITAASYNVDPSNSGLKWHLCDPEKVTLSSDQKTFGYWRGLPEVWRVQDVPTFEILAQGIFEAYPIRRVVLRCEMSRILVNTCDMSMPEHLPETLFRLLEDGLLHPPDGFLVEHRSYDTHILARTDLERAFVVHGRRLARVPDLKETA